MTDAINTALREFGRLFGWVGIGASVGAWLLDHSVAIFSIGGVLFSCWIEWRTYQLKKAEAAKR